MSPRPVALTVLSCLLAACAASAPEPEGAVLAQAAPRAVQPVASAEASDAAVEPAAADPTGVEPAAVEPGVEPAAAGTSVAAASLAAGRARAEVSADSQRRADLDREEDGLWKSEAFQRFLTLSYLADTDTEPSLTERQRKTVMDVLELIDQGKEDEALEVLREENADGGSPTMDFLAARLHFGRDETELALASLQRAVRTDPKFRRAWQELGVNHFRQGDYAEAVTALTRSMQLGPTSDVQYGMLGFSYYHLDNALSAESAFRMAVLLDPLTLDWKKGLAYSLFKQSRFGEAVSLCGTLIAEQPNKADLWLLQANAYIGLSQPLKAAENYEMVERLGGATYDSLVNLGDIYINEDLYGLAVDAHLKGLALAPEAKLERTLRAARSLAARGANDETRVLAAGIEELRGGTLTDVDKKELLRLRASVALAEGAGDEEAAVLEEIVALDPLDGQALILLGRHRARNGQVEEAIAYYERAADLEDHEADACVAHAQLLVNEGRAKEALPLLRRAQGINPRDHVQDYLDAVERLAGGR